jgi:hypothetical protein
MPRVDPPDVAEKPWPNRWNFIPSKEWQRIPDHADFIPPDGAQSRDGFDGTEMRWTDPVPGPEKVGDRNTSAKTAKGPERSTQSANGQTDSQPKSETDPKSTFHGYGSIEHFNASLDAVVYLERIVEDLKKKGHRDADKVTRMAKAVRTNHQRCASVSGMAKTYEFKGASPVSYLNRGIRPTDIFVGLGFLEACSAVMIAGPSGIGKSSIGTQIGCCWSCGAEAFELAATRPLRIVMMQNEDSHNDLVRMSQVAKYLGLDLKLIEKNFWIETVRGKVGKAAIEIMRALCVWHKADVLILNPLSAYHDGDISQNRDNIRFLYDGLGELLDTLRIGIVALHHKTKPQKNGQKKGHDFTHDVMYDVLGGSTLTNFFRGIIGITQQGDSTPPIYKFTLAKRFDQSGWDQRDLYFKWHQDNMRRLWVPATVGEAKSARNKTTGKTVDDLRKLVPITGTIGRDALLIAAQNANFTRDLYRGLLDQALDDSTPDASRLYEWSIYNPKGRARIAYGRSEQPADETHDFLRDQERQKRKPSKQ